MPIPDATPLRVLLVVDRLDWALGTLAREVRRCCAPAGVHVEIVEEADILREPARVREAAARSDAVHWLSPHGYLAFRDLLAGAPHASTIHHLLPGDRLEPAAFDGATIYTVCRQTEAELGRRGFSVRAVTRNGVDAALFHPMDRITARGALDLGPELPVVGFAGKASSNPDDRKGIAVLQDVLERLRQRGPLGALLLGEGWEPVAASLREGGIDARVLRPPSAEELRPLYAALDVYVCTSRVEGGPLPVLEAMACARPVVATPVGLVPEVLVDGETGFRAPVGDAAAIATAVARLLDDPALALRLGCAARRTVEDDWTWDRALAGLPALYRELAHRPPRRAGGIARAYARAKLELLRRARRPDPARP